MVKSDGQGRPERVPNSQDHDQVLEVVQELRAGGLDDEAARLDHVLLGSQSVSNLALVLGDLFVEVLLLLSGALIVVFLLLAILV